MSGWVSQSVIVSDLEIRDNYHIYRACFYLSLVPLAALAYFFSSRRTLSYQEAIETALSKVHPKNVKGNCKTKPNLPLGELFLAYKK